MKRITGALLAASFLIPPGLSHSAPTPPPMREAVAVCDPAYPTANCIKPNADGSINISGGGGGGPVTVANGADVALGNTADAAWVSGSATLIALGKAQVNALLASLPAGNNLLGKTGIDQTTPGTTNGVVINSGNLTADAHAQCSALCANLAVKASAGTLKTFEVSADSTLSGAIWYVIVYDATSAPVDGAVTPAKCYQQAPGTTQMGGTLSTGGSAMATGITIGVSTTGCFNKTASTHAFIAADYQ